MSSAQSDHGTSVLAASDRSAVLHRTLAELCRAEVPLPAALRAAADDLSGSALADSVRTMADEIESGASIGEAYATHATAFPRLYRGLVEAGVSSGDLPAVLDEIAAHAASRAEAEQRIRRALAYPTVAAGFVAVVGALLAIFVGPVLDRLQADVAGGATEALFSARTPSSWLELFAKPGLPVMVAGGAAAIAAAAIFAFTSLRRPLDGCAGVTARAFRWPVIGRMRLYAEISTLTAALAILLRRRTPLTDAFALASSSCGEPGLRSRFDAMSVAASNGATLAASLREGGVIAPSLVWIVEAAEKRGEAPAALDQVAGIYRDRLSRASERAALFATPVAEVVVGAMVLLVALAFIGRLVSMTMGILG